MATSPPEEWRTSTRYQEEAEGTPEYITSTPRRIPRRDFSCFTPRALRRPPIPRRLDLTSGVAIVPRRVDFDVISDSGHFDDEENLEHLARETLRLKSAARPTYMPEPTAPPPERLRRSRPTQYPSPMRQYTPRMTTVTLCGKCLRRPIGLVGNLKSEFKLVF
ncbi:hypothetical protein X777_07133 [Ooceraea biroi]|uniref:Uncharacterized protein n=1 Tax=Ooceraea biroi TaxID=2015173 RepID=A0A026W9G7_OOCBI|nr:hypothetical protein X777_07133 [Ooceraea biroi]